MTELCYFVEDVADQFCEAKERVYRRTEATRLPAHKIGNVLKLSISPAKERRLVLRQC